MLLLGLMYFLNLITILFTLSFVSLIATLSFPPPPLLLPHSYMGTPTEVSWPGISQLAHYSSDLLPQWPVTPLRRRDWGDLSPDGVDLLEVGEWDEWMDGWWVRELDGWVSRWMVQE